MQLLLSRPVLACFAVFALSSMALTGFQNYSIPVFDRLHHMSLVPAGSAPTGYLLGGGVGYLLGGFVAAASDRHGAITAAGALGTAVMYLAIAWMGLSAPMVIAVSAIAGLFLGTVTPSRDVIVRAVAPKEAGGKDYGLVYSGLDLGAPIAPPVFGWMMDYELPAMIFTSMAGAMIVAALLLVQMGGRGVGAVPSGVRAEQRQ